MGRHKGHDKPHGTKGASPTANGLDGPKIDYSNAAHHTGKRKKTPLFGKLQGGQPKFTKEMQIAFLKEFRRHGRITTAAMMAGTTRQTVESYKKNDPNFSRAMETAEELYKDELFTEAHRRAVHGTLEPLIGGKDKDIVVAKVRKFSDTLLMAHMKKLDPGFKDKLEVESTNVNTNLNAEVDLKDLGALDPEQLKQVEGLLASLGGASINDLVAKQQSEDAARNIAKQKDDKTDSANIFTDEDLREALRPVNEDVRKAPDFYVDEGDGVFKGSDDKLYDKDLNRA